MLIWQFRTETSVVGVEEGRRRARREKKEAKEKRSRNVPETT